MQAHRAWRGLCYRPISDWREGEAGRYIYIPGLVPHVMSVLSPPHVAKAIRHTPKIQRDVTAPGLIGRCNREVLAQQVRRDGQIMLRIGGGFELALLPAPQAQFPA